MTGNEKTTALIPSVGADGGQPPHDSTNQSIPHETCESNPPEENIEEMREKIRRMNDPRYLHTVSMTELYQTAYKSCQRQCNFVVFRRTENVEKWRVKVYSHCIIILAVFVRQA